MKTFWSVPEACVWAATREAEAVDAVSASDPEGVHFLLESALPMGEGHHVIAWRTYLIERAGGSMPTAFDAFAMLPELCARGEIAMLGIERDSGDPAPIHQDLWANLEIFSSETARGFVAGRRGRLLNPTSRWWANLIMRSDEVVKVWPPVVAPAETSMRAVADGASIDVEKVGKVTDEEIRRSIEGHQRRPAGRPREWDWDGALAHLVAFANRPDGLPEKAAGTERIVARYFEERTDGRSPAPSAIRDKVKLVYDSITKQGARPTLPRR